MFCAGPFVLRQVGHGGKYIYVYNMLLLPLNYLSIRDLLCSRLIVGGHKSSSRGAVGRMCAIIIDLRKTFRFPGAGTPAYILHIYIYTVHDSNVIYILFIFHQHVSFNNHHVEARIHEYP